MLASARVLVALAVTTLALFAFVGTAAAAPPMNDDFSDFVELFDGDAVPGTTVDSTVELNETVGPYSGRERTVWYSFEAPANGELTFDTCDASFDSYVVVFTGDSVDNLTALAQNDQGCPSGSGTKISGLRLREGDITWIRVQGWDLSYFGTFTASLNFDEAAANDDFESAQALDSTDDNGSASFNNAFASRQASEPVPLNPILDRSLWYSYTPRATGYVTLDTCDATGDSGVTVFTGSTLGTLTADPTQMADQGCPTGSGSKVPPFQVTGGTTYWIQVAGYSATPMTATLTASFELAPANDNWDEATDLGSVFSASVTDDNRWATRDGAPLIQGVDRNASVWYRWMAPETDTFFVDSCDGPVSTTDNVLAVFSTDAETPAADDLDQVAYDDDSCDGNRGGFGKLTLNATKDKVYWIVFSQYSTTDPPVFSDYTLKISSAPQNTALPTISGADRLVGTALSVNTGTWGGSSPIDFTYQWQRCDSAGDNCSDIVGATSSTYTLDAAEDGSTVRAVVTATNAFGSASATTAQTTLVDADLDSDGRPDDTDVCDNAAEGPGKTNGCPVEGVEITTQPSLSGSAVVGSTITLTPGTAANDPGLDPDVGAPTRTIYWYSCSSPTIEGSCDVRAGSGVSYTVVADDVGRFIRSEVAWENSDGSDGSAWTPATSTVVHPDTDSDGVPDLLDDCPSTARGVNGKANGCPADPVAPPAAPAPLDLASLVFPKKVTIKKLVKNKGKYTIAQDLVACPAGGPGCALTLSLTAKVKVKGKKRTIKLGTSNQAIPAGTTAPLTGKLSKKGLSALKKAKKLKADMAIIGTGGVQGKKNSAGHVTLFK